MSRPARALRGRSSADPPRSQGAGCRDPRTRGGPATRRARLLCRSSSSPCRVSIPPPGLAMLNRFLFLLVAVISPASSVAMLFSGHPAGVAFAERMPCLAFALVALLLAALHGRPTTDRSAPFEAAMWLRRAPLLRAPPLPAPPPR